MQYFPLQKSFRLGAVASLALLLAGGCSSRNPDALTGMNVDENLAMMNADENVAAESAATEAPTNEQVAAASSNEASDESAPAKPPKHATASDEEEANAADTGQVIEPDEPTTGNQGVENEDEPHQY